MPNQPNAGFSLIELLVVLVIISLVISIAFIRIGDVSQRHQLINDLFALKDHIVYIEQEAILNDSEYLIEFSPNAYWIKQRNSKGHWTILTKTLTKQFSIHTRPILIRPEGEITPFNIKINTKIKTDPIQLIGEKNGTIRIEGVIE